MAEQGPLLVRADANERIGAGHVMRCLALAQAWQDVGGTAHFASGSIAPALEERLRVEGMGTSRLDAEPGSAADAAQTITLAREMEVAWVVVDGYQFDAPHQRALKEAGFRLLFLDDYGHATHYYADLVLNQNIHAHPSLYARREPVTTLLLGTRYALLRREFQPWRGWQRKIPPVARKVLVTLGGADPKKITLKVIQALGLVKVSSLETVVVVGGSNPHYEELQAAARHSSFTIRLKHNVANMASLMARADVAVSAGGSTCWELAFMGLPSLVLALADNQDAIAEGLDSAGVVRSLDRKEDVTVLELCNYLVNLIQGKAVRAKMCGLGQQLVDGLGGHRVALELISGKRA
jgi:UDP-2,4-diacetamido-2,4,6-trideoxy-beta-L-altropyranose hydrolase